MRWSVAVVGAAALAAAPVALGFRIVRERSVLLMPDLLETALAAQGAGHGQQFVGAWSRLGLYHPGPLWFWWASPFFAAAGAQPSGLFFAALALVAVGGPAVVAMIGVEAGALGGGVAAVTLLAAVHQLGLVGLAAPWNPTVLIVPVAVGLVAAAVSWRRAVWWTAPVAVAAGSFTAQAHLGAVGLGGLITASTLAGVVRQRRSIVRPWRLGLALAVVLVAAWSPVVFDQVAGSGNLGAVSRYVATGEVDPRFAPEPPSRSLQLQPEGVVAQLASVTAMVEGDGASWAGADFQRGLEHRPSPWSVATLVVLVGCAVAGIWTDGFLRPLSTLALLGLLVELVAAARGRHEFRPYLIAGGAGVGIVLWLVAALLVTRWLRPRLRLHRPVPRLVAMTVGCMAVGFLALSLPVDRFPGLPLSIDHRSSAIARIQRLDPASGVELRVDDVRLLNAQQRLVLALEHAGVRVGVHGRYGSRFSDRQRRHRGGREIVWSPADSSRPASCRPLGPFADGSLCLMPARGSA